MRLMATLSGILLIVVFLLIPCFGTSEDLSQKIKEGRDLHLKILARYKSIEKSYHEPFIHGAATSNPLCCIAVPLKDWESLADEKKQTLAAYAASLVNEVKANPFKYTGINPNAPAAKVIRANVAKMTDNSWGIMAGNITPNGRDITSDKIVRLTDPRNSNHP